MLPTVVASEIKSELKNFLEAAFPISNFGFQQHNHPSLIESFFNDNPENLIKGPWLEVKMPFRTANVESLPLQNISLGFAPYLHQYKSFERLCGALPQSTIVATGTGSGKTECFLYPILDYCLQERRPGIKAIVIYPMNALAADQAKRFAEEVAKLDTKLTVGMFVGLDRNSSEDSRPKMMGEDYVIGDHETLRQSPPDILLTNYKMLDFLLMRPVDQPIWKHNLTTQGLLRYLVVDELHTFDGAQGTDLACLVRRLKDKLNLAGELACVGTSATIGSEEAVEQLLDYATDIFATDFQRDAIITEDRLSVDEYIVDFKRQFLPESFDFYPALVPDAIWSELQPQSSPQGMYLKDQAFIWFEKYLPLDADKDSAEYKQACVDLGCLLHRHPLFMALLKESYQLVDLNELAGRWKRDYNIPSFEHAVALLDSLTALVSTARVWRNQAELKVAPLLHVRVQMWLRELRRMLASVSQQPKLEHADDLSNPREPLHLPIIHCRDCHSAAWGAVRKQGTHEIEPDLQEFYQRWFSNSPDAVLIYPEPENSDKAHLTKGEVRKFCVECLSLHSRSAAECRCGTEEPLMLVRIPDLTVRKERNGNSLVLRDDICPECRSQNSIAILGSRAASLSSVVIARLFGTNNNDDHKLITFSDSVQDAAQRAGFFSSRTYKQTIRRSIALAIQEFKGGNNFGRFIRLFPEYWRNQYRQHGLESFVGTFIAPNMQWLGDYQQMLLDDKLPEGNLVGLVEERLGWELLVEFGLGSSRGRTIESEMIAIVQPESNRLDALVERLGTRWAEELGTLQDASYQDIKHFVVGVLEQWRKKGAFYHPVLHAYVKSKGKEFLLNRTLWMPGYGKRVTPPAAITIERVDSNFTHLISDKSTWYSDWFNKVLASDEQFFASGEYNQAMAIFVDILQREGWLEEISTEQFSAWLMKLDVWQVESNRLVNLACDSCSKRQVVSETGMRDWLGAECLNVHCVGHYQIKPTKASGESSYLTYPVRLVSAEHTGLVEGAVRERVEKSFKTGTRPWDVNLLSATPTLEMGIDIGNLSAVLLCSVPPAQANYLQRIGRAGRTNGNALALTVANASNHDNYFYEQPLEMMLGDVQTPGVFLNATAVLERQLIAFSFDRWVTSGVAPNAIPSRLGEVLKNIEKNVTSQEVFPYSVLSFIENNKEALLNDFVYMFPMLDGEGRQHLYEFIGVEGEGDSPLSWRVTNQLQHLYNITESNRKRAIELKKRLKTEEALPADDARNERVVEINAERDALIALNRTISRQATLNFFTDEGLLPNYAFPEEGVTLNSIIVRRKEIESKESEDEADQKQSSKNVRVTLKFQRSAQAALSELAPDNHFYAAEHKIRIDKVDLEVTKPTTWQLCPSCHYSCEAATQEIKHSACPRCNSPHWNDTQQKQTLLKLRQVYAYANARNDRIDDSAENREIKFYNRQLLVDVPPNEIVKAVKIDSEELPFGFELIKQATFREINFGEHGNASTSFYVAGKENPRQGFKICRHCGRVKHKFNHNGRKFQHDLDCKLSQPNAVESESDWFESLYLYRELKSEAIRILLPLADVAESETARNSLVAALNMGLREYFRGAVDHLEITDMTVPNEATGKKQFLVVYDRVPGGTGYLKQLLHEPAHFFEMLEKAKHKLENCSCATDEHKDGCYSCILAYRSSNKRETISRKSAAELLGEIVEHKNNLATVDALTDVNTNHLLESVLEERFVAALGRHTKLNKQLINNKAGYLLNLGEAQDLWVLELQVDFYNERYELVTRADFVLKPFKETEQNKQKQWVVFLDGFEFHNERIKEDLAKRQYLRNQGYQVLVLAWDDVPDAELSLDLLKAQNQESTLIKQLVAEALPVVRKFWDQFSHAHSAMSYGQMSDWLKQHSFVRLISWMQNPEQENKLWQHAAIFLAAHLLRNPNALLSWLDSNESEYESSYAALAQQLRVNHESVQGLSQESHGFWQLLNFVSSENLSQLGQALPPFEVFLLFDDIKFKELDSVEFKQAWKEFWQVFNILQFGYRLYPLTHQQLLDGDYENVFVATEESSDSKENALTEEWIDVQEYSALTKEQFAALLELNIPAPIVGQDVMNSEGVTIATAELSWPEHKVLVLLDMEDLSELSDWHVIVLEDAGWLNTLRQCFNL